MTCKVALNRTNTSQKYFTKLIEMGYEVHTPQNELWDKLKKYDVTNLTCGHRFQAQGGNIMNGMSKCAVCGPKIRIEAAMAAYKRRYGRTYDLKKREDYTKVVMALSAKNNPAKRSRSLHLDHIISIDWGFRNGVPPEMIADADNLRLLDAKQNIAKGALVSDFNLLKRLVEKYNVPIKINSDSGQNPAISMLMKRIPELLVEIDAVAGKVSTPKQNIQIIDVDNPTAPLDDHIIIFSDEVVNASNADRRLRIIVERILHKEGLHTQKIFARKCSIAELDTLTASRFLDANHFQGRGASRIKIGLKHGDELVAVMTFGKPRFAKKYDWELIRYATAGGVTVVGGASRLLAYFRKTFGGTIITYSDRRWGNGGLYAALGFKKIATSKPNYWWCKNGERISRYQTQLNLLPSLLGTQYNSALSENDNMRNVGWKKIQDLGNDVFVIE